jgi:hypothetical protein
MVRKPDFLRYGVLARFVFFRRGDGGAANGRFVMVVRKTTIGWRSDVLLFILLVCLSRESNRCVVVLVVLEF